MTSAISSDVSEVQLVEDQSLEIQAQAVVDKYVKWSFGAGLIPVPLIDLVAVTSIQIKMLSEVANIYSVPFSEHGVRTILASLLGGALPHTVKTQTTRSVFKLIPGIGTLIGLVVMPTLSAASTNAVGKVFIKHFESGGNFLNINLDAAKSKSKELIDKYKKTDSAVIAEAEVVDAEVVETETADVTNSKIKKP